MNEYTREAIEHMENTDGWKIVSSYIDDRIEDHSKQLLTCDLDKVVLHRNSINTLKLIYDQIDSLKSTEVVEHP